MATIAIPRSHMQMSDLDYLTFPYYDDEFDSEFPPMMAILPGSLPPPPSPIMAILPGSLPPPSDELKPNQYILDG